MKLRFGIICILLAISINCLADNNSWFQRNFRQTADTNFIVDLHKTLGLKAFFSNKYSNFTIRNLQNHNSLNYESTANRAINVGFIYKWIDLNAGYSYNFLNKQNDLKSNSKQFDVQAKMFLRSTSWWLFVNAYKGYDLSNAGKVLSDYKPGTYYSRNDIRAFSMRGAVNYFFNYTQYSNRATQGNGARQQKSAGSAVAGIQFIFNSVVADSSFVPTNLNNNSIFAYNFDDIEYFSVGANIGYTYTFVYKHNWVASSMIVGGISYGNKKQYANNQINTDTDNAFNLFLQGELSAGYCCNRFNVMLRHTFQSTQTPVGDRWNNVVLLNGNTQLLFIYRLNLKRDLKFIPYPHLADW
ncbi:MAG: DUF4421 domain-containing protein [Salinivirgaceae bacterium]|nr:DUF4421 domain-containing protein [Salinivirgaceae bacterium]